MELVAQAHGFQCSLGSAAAFGPADAGDGQSQLDIGQHRLVGDQVVALEDEADGVVAVGIPVPVGIVLGRNAVDDEIAAVIAVQTADDVQKRGLTGAGGAQDGYEFVVPEGQAHPVQGHLDKIAGLILLADILYL